MNRRPELRRTPTRRFLLNELKLWGSREFRSRRYTLSLRIMEEHGYVGQSLGRGKWYLKRRGETALERWQA